MSLSLSLIAECLRPCLSHILAHPREPSRNTWIGFERSRFIRIDRGAQWQHDAITAAYSLCSRCDNFFLPPTLVSFVLVRDRRRNKTRRTRSHAVIITRARARIDGALTRDGYTRRCKRFSLRAAMSRVPNVIDSFLSRASATRTRQLFLSLSRR